MTSRRERREFEEQQFLLEEKTRRKKRLLIVYSCVCGIVLFSASAVLIWKATTDNKPDTSTQATNAKDKGKSLETITAELKEKAIKQKQTKEWIWGDTGHTELIIQAYKDIKLSGSAAHEERVRLLNILTRAVKPKAEWPSAFTLEKAKDVVNFAKALLGPTAQHESAAALNVLGAYGAAIKELTPETEEALIRHYAIDTRPGIRGECLAALGRMQSRTGFKLIKKATESDDSATVKASIYALDLLINGPADAEARTALLAVARKKSPHSPLAVKLLAKHGDMRVVQIVPKLLEKNAAPPEIEAAAYTIGKLKLRQFRDLLETQLKGSEPVLAPLISESLKQLDN